MLGHIFFSVPAAAHSPQVFVRGQADGLPVPLPLEAGLPQPVQSVNFARAIATVGLSFLKNGLGIVPLLVCQWRGQSLGNFRPVLSEKVT